LTRISFQPPLAVALDDEVACDQFFDESVHEQWIAVGTPMQDRHEVA